MGRIGIGEIIFIGLAVVLLFGTKKLPEIGQALGNAIREFKKASKDIQGDVNEAVNDKNDVKRS
jgi:sec-independent protein translocase protein TatA